MQIDFEDAESCIVSVPCSIVDNDTGDCVLDGQKLMFFSLRTTHDPCDAPEVSSYERSYKFEQSTALSVGLIVAGLEPAYRIDDDAPTHDKVFEAVSEEWWKLYGEESFEWVFPTHDMPGYWRGKI